MGEQIPLASQIISLADTYDAITTDRIYRKSRSKEIAIDIIMNEKNRQFDAKLVDIFIDQIKVY